MNVINVHFIYTNLTFTKHGVGKNSARKIFLQIYINYYSNYYVN